MQCNIIYFLQLFLSNSSYLLGHAIQGEFDDYPFIDRFQDLAPYWLD